MRLPRFTVRRLMVLVAVVAFGFGLAPAIGRQVGRMIKRRSHDFTVASLNHGLRVSPPHRTRADRSRSSATDRKLAAYHRALATKYAWAAHHPWLPVWPDPPEPK